MIVGSVHRCDRHTALQCVGAGAVFYSALGPPAPVMKMVAEAYYILISPRIEPIIMSAPVTRRQGAGEEDSMDEFAIVLVTASGRDEAEEIATRLISSGLSPCVNIITSCHSIYQWKGEFVKDDEVLMLIKSRRSDFGELSAMVHKMHSYDVPEILAVGISDISERYLGYFTRFFEGAGP